MAYLPPKDVPRRSFYTGWFSGGAANTPADLGLAQKPVQYTVKKVPTETSAQSRQTKAEFEGTLKANREKLDAVTNSTGKTRESPRDGDTHAWKELEEAVLKAHSEF